MSVSSANAPAQRRCHPSAAPPCSTGQSQGASGPELLVNSSHPVASGHDQLAWEQALGGAAAAQEQQPDAFATQQEAPPHPHPVVGATQQECMAWEAALAGLNSSASAEQQSPVYAVVECGSHSTRLLLSTGSGRDLARLTRDTHLGAAVGQPAAAGDAQQQQQAVPAAAAATLAAVRDYQLIVQHQQHLRGVAVVATAAVREAAEGPSVAAAVSGILNCPVRILTGDIGGPLALAAVGALSGSAQLFTAAIQLDRLHHLLFPSDCTACLHAQGMRRLS